MREAIPRRGTFLDYRGFLDYTGFLQLV